MNTNIVPVKAKNGSQWGISKLLFVFFILWSTGGLWHAERKLVADHLGTALNFVTVGLPWFLLVASGIRISLDSHANRLDKELAARLLMVLGLTALMTYNAIDLFR